MTLSPRSGKWRIYCHRLNSLPFLTGEFSDLSVEVVKHLQGCRPEPGGVH